MYGLQGLGSPNQLAVDMPDQTVKIFYSITQDLGAALQAGGKPQRPYNFGSYNTNAPVWGLAPNGYYVVTQFMGGFLLDGCPLNIIFGQGWQPGQQAALQSGGITCNASMMTPTVPTTSAGPIPGSTNVNATQFNTGPNYTNTNPTQVIISPGQGSPAPTTSAGGGGPILPTGPGGPIEIPPGIPPSTGLPPGSYPTNDWTFYIAIGVIAFLLLNKKKGA